MRIATAAVGAFLGWAFQGVGPSRDARWALVRTEPTMVPGLGLLFGSDPTLALYCGAKVRRESYAPLAEAVAAPPTSPAAAIPEAFTAAFGAPPTPVVKQEAESGETKADANTIEAPAPVAEAPAAATATAEVSAPATAETAAAPKPSPTKKPSIKPVMPGGRKKTNKKKKKGNKKK